jgi:hypothetical protein
MAGIYSNVEFRNCQRNIHAPLHTGGSVRAALFRGFFNGSPLGLKEMVRIESTKGRFTLIFEESRALTSDADVR